jgi:signal transduction histidine kinase
MNTTGRRRIVAAAVAIGGPAVVTLLALTDVHELVPALLYVLCVAAAAAAGGIWAGVLASVCAFVPFNYFFTEPKHSFRFSNVDEVVSAVVLLATALGVGWIIEREKRARDAADAERSAAAEARARAERAARDAARLRLAAEALSRAVSPADVLDAVVTVGVEAAEARAGMIAVVSDDGRELVVLASRGYREGLMTTWQRFPIDAEYPLSEAVRTGEPVFIRSRTERVERYPTLSDGDAPTFALVCLPLIVEDETIGGLVFSFGSDQEFDEERRALKVALARQAAQALARARLYEALRQAEGRVSFLAEAGDLLSASLDYEEQMQRLAKITVPRLADWCTVDVVDDAGRIKRLAVAHADPNKAQWGVELQRRFPSDPDAETGVAAVLRTGVAEFVPEIAQETLDTAVAARPELKEVLDQLGLRSWLCVPLKASDRVLGALALATAESGRTFTGADLDLATALAGRAGVAIENALLYREAERRGDAARALTYVGDAVVLVDRDGVLRYWNRAAELVFRLPREAVPGVPARDAVPGWEAVTKHVRPVDASTGEVARATTVPVVLGEDERWLSCAAVDFDEGCVYAVRDVTEEHALEQERTDFVATASHELRTPLAAVYGAVRTLRRTDTDIGDTNRELFLSIIETETERLNRIVAQILFARQIEEGDLGSRDGTCDLRSLTEEVVAAARLRAPAAVRISVNGRADLPPVRGDEDKLRQALVNLVENAIKYSPEGGDVVVDLAAENGTARITVRDPGIGIAPSDQERIFDKFTRLDPAQSRGVGGSGLGLYITRELITRMGGTLSVESTPGRGSTFAVELPLATA